MLREGDVIEAGDSEFTVQFRRGLSGLRRFRHVRGVWWADPDRIEIGPIDERDLAGLGRGGGLALQ